MKKSLSFRNPAVLVVGIYLISVAVRFLLATATSAYPMINIDEFLYYGMARSIVTEQQLLFRGQPADYSYILYSLFLSPVYLLGLEGPVLYRMLQLWNIMILSLSVFPIYGLAKAFTKDAVKAVHIAGISMLLPDFMIGQLMMGENVITPLFFAAVYFAYKYFERKKLRDILILGILGGLLFSVKPGVIIIVAVMLLICLAEGVRAKDRAVCFHAISGGATTGIVIGVFFLMVMLLGGNTSVLSIYAEQVSNSSHLDVFFRFLAVYPLYFILACGVGCFIIPFSRFKNYTSEQKKLFIGILISLTIAIIGVCWSVNRYEYNAKTTHMRYIGMYIPLFFIFSMLPGAAGSEAKGNLRKKALPLSAAVLLGITVALSIFPGVYSGVSHANTLSENMTLSAFRQLYLNRVPALAVICAVAVLCALYAYFFRSGREKALERTALTCLVACMLLNNVTAYKAFQGNTNFEAKAEAQALASEIEDTGNILYILTEPRNSAYYGALDGYSKNGFSYVALNDLFNHLYEAKGAYIPFVPQMMRGNVPDRPTPDTDTIVMDASVYSMLKLSDNTSHLSINPNRLHLVKILDRSKPWVDCVMGNVSSNVLAAGDTGILVIFNESYLSGPLTVHMKIYSEQGTSATMFSNVETHTLQLEPGLHEYDVVFSNPQNAYNFIADSGDIRIDGYDIFTA